MLLLQLSCQSWLGLELGSRGLERHRPATSETPANAAGSLSCFSGELISGSFCQQVTPAPALPRGSAVKNPPTDSGDTRDAGSIAGWGSSPEAGNGNPLQYCLEIPMDRGAWWVIVHRVINELDVTEQLPNSNEEPLLGAYQEALLSASCCTAVFLRINVFVSLWETDSCL